LIEGLEPEAFTGREVGREGRSPGFPSRRQREAVEIGRFGLLWPDIDEDISIAGLLAGRRDQTAKPPAREPTKRRKRA